MERPLVAKRMDDITSSGIRTVFEKASKLEAEGRHVLHLEAGRPDFDTPLHIKSAAASALDGGMVHYTPSPGIPVLREAMAASILEHKKIEIDPNTEIMMTAGGQGAMYLALQATINPGDEVLVPNPGFGLFATSTKLVGGIPVSLPLEAEKGYFPDLEQARNLVTDRTRAIIVNSPHNPSGAVWDAEQMEAVCHFAQAHDLLVFSDEAYDRILYDQDCMSPAQFPDMKERTLILGSLSKTYAMTGWRIGYLAGPEAIIEAAVRVQQNLMLSLCAFAQAGAAKALQSDQDCVNDMVAEFKKRRDVILRGIAQTPGLSCPVDPQGAFYVFAKHDVPGMTSIEVTDYLLQEAAVAVVPGTAFGEYGEGYFRISYSKSMEDCKAGMDRIASAMTKLLKQY